MVYTSYKTIYKNEYFFSKDEQIVNFLVSISQYGKIDQTIGNYDGVAIPIYFADAVHTILIQRFKAIYNENIDLQLFTT